MPGVIDYSVVLPRLRERGFISLYHNSGAFGFPADAQVTSIGWLEADDPTIRPAARSLVRRVESIEKLLPQALERIAGDAWLMPKSHWHYELHFGNRELLEALLPRLGIDPAMLRDRNDGSAIEFSTQKRDLLKQAVREMLGALVGSDFSIVFADAATVCTIHHHRQLWWQTTDKSIAAVAS